MLDDISTDTGAEHFDELMFNDGDLNDFIPGENITVQAVAYSTESLTNVMYSNKVTTNSLFADGSNSLLNDGKTNQTAYIENFRHLENLDKNISNFRASIDDKLGTNKAVQRTDLDWSADDDGYWTDKTIRPLSGNGSSGKYYPIEPHYELSYDGEYHSISNVTANSEHAGLFGETAHMTAISNLELIDFSITGNATAGALAATLNRSTGTTVTNVIARCSDNEKALAKKIIAPTAGGLVGNMTGTVSYSAAAVIVRGTANVGGLTGAASGTISGCYAGGHTENGDYTAWVTKKDAHDVLNGYDVTAEGTGIAGGLVGTYFGSETTQIENSYSTCSVNGSTAGGFVGLANGTIENCYATGLVEGTTKYAFLAGINEGETVTLTGNHFYRVINEVPKEGGEEGETEPMLPVNGYELNATNLAKIQPIDLNAETYNAFTGNFDDWNSARAYDAALVQYYNGQYCLKSVGELDADLPEDYFVATHYGDWPSPEVFFVNTKG